MRAPTRPAAWLIAGLLAMSIACGEAVTPTTTNEAEETRPEAGDPDVILRWLTEDGQAVLDGGVYEPGKRVLMEEVDYEVAPERFEIYEFYGSVFDWLIRRYGDHLPLDVSPFEVEEVAEGVARATRPWTLSLPSQLRGRSRYVFIDDHGNRSGLITSTGFTDITIEAEGELPPDIPGVGATASGRLSASGTLILAVDPDVELIVMMPWGSGDADLRTHVIEFIEQTQDTQPGVDWHGLFVEEIDPLLPPEPPDGWEVELIEDSFFGLPAGESVSFEVIFEMPTRGSSLFAIKAVDIEDPHRATISDLFGIERR